MSAGSDARRAFLDAYAAIRPLLADERLRDRWDRESALQGFSTRGLAGHLVRAGASVLTYLSEPAPADADPVPAGHYYATVLPLMDAADHASVTERGEDVAGESPDELVRFYDEVLDNLRTALEAESANRRVRVFRGVVLTLDDYLVTRVVEIVVHADDLAASLEIDPPDPGREALGLAIAHLVDVARAMHGDRNVLIALTRRERDTIDALRVFAPPPNSLQP